MIEVYDPGNDELIGTVPSATGEDVERVFWQPPAKQARPLEKCRRIYASACYAR